MKELKLFKIRKTFGNTVAVLDLNLEVEKGCFFTLLGPSGCGKTTTLRIVAGLIKPDSGDLFIGDSNFTKKPSYLRNIGLVFQNYALFPHMSVYDNIAFGLKMRKVPAEEIRQLVGEVVQLANLSGLVERFPKELSGGQQQRVAVARAIVIKPNVLLLDEPLSNLDLKVRVSMRREIKSLTKKLGITTLNVTHDQGEALSMSDRIGVMNEGRLVQEGTPKEIYERPTNQFVAAFIGETNFLTGTISELDGTSISINVGDYFTIQAKIDSQESRVRETKSNITFYVRPEKVSLSRSRPENVNVLSGCIEDMEYFGSRFRYIVRVGEVMWSCEVGNDKASAFENGESVYLSFSPEDCILS